MQQRLELELAESTLKNKKERTDAYNSNIMQLNNKKQRKWFCARGKADVLDFTDDEIRKLRDCFEALDDDNGGSIGLDELEWPLVGLGLADTREEVEELILSVDDDGDIEFPEFLNIIIGTDVESNEKTEKLKNFFKDMSNGKLGRKDVSFNINVQDIRRK